MDDARHLQALRSVASILVWSPHRAPALIYCNAGSRADVPSAQPRFYEIFTRLESQSGQTARILAVMFAGVTPAEGPPSATGCRTPPEWPLGGVLHAAMRTRRRLRKGLCGEPRQLASANVLSGARPGRSNARSNRMALTTSRRSRMPTSLAIVSSALRSADTR